MPEMAVIRIRGHHGRSGQLGLKPASARPLVMADMGPWQDQ